MGKIRTTLIKRTAEKFIEKSDRFGDGFEENKKILDEMEVASSKRLRNMIAGYITHKLSGNAASE